MLSADRSGSPCLLRQRGFDSATWVEQMLQSRSIGTCSRRPSAAWLTNRQLTAPCSTLHAQSTYRYGLPLVWLRVVCTVQSISYDYS